MRGRRCKPGDIAVIVSVSDRTCGSIELWKNIGLIVRVDHWQDAYTTGYGEHCPAGWHCTSSGKMLRCWDGLRKRAIFFDHHLMPIRPPSTRVDAPELLELQC